MMALRLIFVLIVLLCGMYCQGQDITTWKLSVVTLSAAKAADIQSSWGKQELNPILGRGTFGPRQAAVSAGILGGVVLIQSMAVKKWPRAAKPLTWINFGAAGVTGAVAWGNY